MKQLHSFSLAVVIAMAAFAAIAQPAVIPPAPAPGKAATMATDCAKAPAKRHDHGAERSSGAKADSTAMGEPCAPRGAGSTAGSKTKMKPLHDHAKFNKNQ